MRVILHEIESRKLAASEYCLVTEDRSNYIDNRGRRTQDLDKIRKFDHWRQAIDFAREHSLTIVQPKT